MISGGRYGATIAPYRRQRRIFKRAVFKFNADSQAISFLYKMRSHIR